MADGRLNCRVGDIARIVGMSDCNNDRFVECVVFDPLLRLPGEQEPGFWFVHSNATLSVDIRRRVRLLGITLWTRRISGTSSSGWISDKNLRPIRDPGPDAVDEMLQRVGAPLGLVGIPSDGSE